MTTMEQPEIEFPSAPIEGETIATVDAVARGSVIDDDWLAFVAACESVAEAHDGAVDPNNVRLYLTDWWGDLIIRPRRLSAFYNRAAGKSGFLDFSHWGINGDHKGRNAGRPARIYKIRVSP